MSRVFEAIAVAILAAVGCLLAGACVGAAAADAPGMAMPGMDMSSAAPATSTSTSTVAGTTRTLANYDLPELRLLRDDNRSVRLADELNDGRAVVLNFVYTSCTGVCPLSSQILAELQRKLAGNLSSLHIVSISLDPDQDTPARLRTYAKRFGAGPEWQYYTGTVAASLAAQRAFNVNRGDKMDHAPVTLLRTAPGRPWVRFDGFVTADELLRELPSLVAAK